VEPGPGRQARVGLALDGQRRWCGHTEVEVLEREPGGEFRGLPPGVASEGQDPPGLAGRSLGGERGPLDREEGERQVDERHEEQHGHPDELDHGVAALLPRQALHELAEPTPHSSSSSTALPLTASSRAGPASPNSGSAATTSTWRRTVPSTSTRRVVTSRE